MQRFIVIRPSCILKPDEHSICIYAMFAHKQFHLTRNVAAISSVYQSMKSSKRPFFLIKILFEAEFEDKNIRV